MEDDNQTRDHLSGAQVPSIGMNEAGLASNTACTTPSKNPQYPATKGTANFAKLTRLILDVCPDVIRDILRHCLGAEDKSLCKALDDNRNIMEAIKLHKDDQRLLYNRQEGTPLYTCLDYSLMYKIARHLPKCKSQIEQRCTARWGEVPTYNDWSLLACIERLRIYRNTFMAHVPETDISEDDFKDKWDKIREPIMEIERHLGWGKRYTTGINELWKANIDPETNRVSMELVKKEKQIQEMKEEGGKVLQDVETIFQEVIGLKEQLQHLFGVSTNPEEKLSPIKSSTNVLTSFFLHDWRKKEKYFYETRGYKAAKETLKRLNQVLISGKPGIGKTMVATRLLFEFEKDGYTVQYLKKADDLNRQINPEMKQIILADDIFGESVYDRSASREWITALSFVSKILINGDFDIYFVMTARSYILKAIPEYGKHRCLNKSYEVDLSTGRYDLSLEDKEGILEKLILRAKDKDKALDISNKDKKAIVKCKPPHGYPLCVKWFLFNPKYRNMGVRFFHKPLDFVVQKMEEIIDHDINKYYVLLLILLQKEEEVSLNSTEVCKQVLEKRCLGHFWDNLIKVNVLQIADQMEGLYLKRTSRNTFQFNDESVAEAVMILFGKRDFSEAVMTMEISTLLDKVRIEKEDKNEEFESSTIIVKSKEWDLKDIANRMCCEMYDGNACLTSSYTEWKNERLITAFVNHLQMSESVQRFGNNMAPLLKEDRKKGGNFLYWSARQGKLILCKKLVEYLQQLYLKQKDLPREQLNYLLSVTLLGLCANETGFLETGHLSLVKYVVSGGADCSFCQLCSNVENAEDITSSVLKQHITPLEEAAKQKMESIVLFLLESRAFVKHFQWNGWEFLHCAAMENAVEFCNANFINCLIQYESLRTKNENEDMSIMLNPQSSQTDIVISIVRDCNAQMSTEEKNSLFLSLVNSIPMTENILKCICNFGAEMTCTNEFKQTALHLVVCSQLKTEIILETLELLLKREEQQVDVLDKHGMTPLIHCIRESKPVELAGKLLGHGANPYLIDSFGLSALHYCLTTNELREQNATLLMKMLVERKFENTFKYRNIKSPMKLAIDIGLKRQHLIPPILKFSHTACEPDLLHYTINSNHNENTKIELIRTMLACKIAVNCQDEVGRTPLMVAVQASYPCKKLVKFLLENGAKRQLADKDQRTIIHHCILSDRSDEEVVELIGILEKGSGRFRLDSTDKNEHTPLVLCCTVRDNRQQTLKKLLSLGANPNAKDRNGRTVLHHVIASAKADDEVVTTVQLLHKHKAKFDLKQGEKLFMLALSSKYDRYKTIKYIIENMEKIAAPEGGGKTYIHLCVDSVSLDDGQTKAVIASLVKKGVDIDKKDGNGIHVFDAMLRHPHPRIETIKFIIQESKTLKTYRPQNIMEDLVKNNKLFYEIVDTLRESGIFTNISPFETNVFHDIAEQSEPPAQFDKVAESLCKSGFEIDKVDSIGNSALLNSCKGKSSLHFIKVLLDNGADPNLRNHEGKVALHYCVESERSDKDALSIAELLCDKGCDFDITDSIERSPLYLAIKIKSERFQVIQFLLQKKANVVRKDRNGFMSVHHCIASDRPDRDACAILEMILEKDEICLDVRDSKGCTPLNLAASMTKYSRIICIIRLLEKNCITETVNDFLRSPVFNAIYCIEGRDILISLERVTRVALLLAFKCDPATKCKDDLTPKSIADEMKYSEIQELLAEHHSQKAMLTVLRKSINKVMRLYQPQNINMRETCSKRLTNEFKIFLKNASSFLNNAEFNEIDDSLEENSSDFLES